MKKTLRARARARSLAVAGALVSLGCPGSDGPDRRSGTDPSPAIRDAGAATIADGGRARNDAGPDLAAPTVYVGVVAAGQAVNVTPRIAGLIRAVHVSAGDAVTEGQVIVEMDPNTLQDELREAEANLNASAAAQRLAAVEVADARRQLALEVKAVEEGLSPKQNVEDARLSLRRAEAAADEARALRVANKARVEAARAHVKDTSLKAPFAGVVSMRYRDPGNRVTSGEPILKLVGSGRLRLRFAIPPDRSRQVTVGDKVSATVDTVEGPIVATVEQVSPSIDPASGMIIVDALLPDAPNTSLQPGLAARVVHSPGPAAPPVFEGPTADAGR